MSDRSPLRVVFCWHMHQPDYRGPDHSDYKLPWVYLHAIKDYSDMAAHLEMNSKARAVVNFAPILLEQLDDYSRQIQDWLKLGKLIQDPVLAALAGPGVPMDMASRKQLIQACSKANEKHMINRFRTFRRLADIATWTEKHPDSATYLNDQFLVDLLVWYHLAWMGEYVRVNDLRIISLEKKRYGYTGEDRRCLIETIGDLITGIIGRYKKLAETGQIELSVTPYAHPILPLLLNMESSKEAMPDIDLPEVTRYPGGEPRARWHIRQGIAAFEKHFGFQPKGCWPAEGAINNETLRLLEEEGFRWAASGQQVLHNSLNYLRSGKLQQAHWVHEPYRLGDGRLNCFFRDDGLSDLIGFTYADWHADDAVANLIQHLENIESATRDKVNPVVSIIMDGENAWEYYPRNGCYFLNTLYEKIAAHPRLELTTFIDCIEHQDQPVESLTQILAGSWVYGTFSTWIGDPDKNRAWEMLVQAKQAYDQVIQNGHLSWKERREVEFQLATCEGSDWFWWFGDYNPSTTVSDFERLFRQQLIHLYELLGVEPPAYLSKVFSRGSGDPTMGGVMRKNS